MKTLTIKNPVPATSENISADFITSKELLRRIPICRKTLSGYVKAGKIPSVRLGGRKLLFHVPSVTEAILRFQRCNQ
jgi:predicted site-specific integrase-resolvase